MMIAYSIHNIAINYDECSHDDMQIFIYLFIFLVYG